MNEYPKITVVTPNYNKGEFLEQTILSVLSQGYPNLEYIIVDGGSTDGSLDIIKRYSDRLAWWVSEPDKGVYDAVRKGFEHSTGEIMSWIGSDDMYHARSLFTVAKVFTDLPKVQWVTGVWSHYDSTGSTVNVQPAMYFSRTDLLSTRFMWIQQESTFWRRSLYDKVGGLPTQWRLAGDLALWIAFSRYAELYLLRSLIGGFRITGGGQLSSDMSGYISEAMKIIASELQDHPEDKRPVSQRLWRRRLHAALQRIFGRRLALKERDPQQEKRHTISYDFATASYILN